MVEAVGPLGPVVEPGDVLRLLQNDDVRVHAGHRVHGVPDREDAQQQLVITARVEGDFERGRDACHAVVMLQCWWTGRQEKKA